MCDLSFDNTAFFDGESVPRKVIYIGNKVQNRGNVPI